MIELEINGAPVSLDCEPDASLLTVVRDLAGLNGSRRGCLIGLCGACTMHLDGKAIRPCVTTVEQAQGHALTTIEGVLRTPLGKALMQVWSGPLAACFQCRHGRIMASAALLAASPQPSNEEVEAALHDHTCDCGEIVDAGTVLRQVGQTVS